MVQERIVAAVLLPQRHLDVIGTGLRRMFAIDAPEEFSDLLDQLDRIDAGEPTDRPVQPV